METTFDYLRAHVAELGARILETYPPLQSTKDPIASAVATLLRKALPAQGLAITGTATSRAGRGFLMQRQHQLLSGILCGRIKQSSNDDIGAKHSSTYSD